MAVCFVSLLWPKITIMEIGIACTFNAKLEKIFPDIGCRAHMENEYALPYHAISPVLLNCEVILGMAVAMIEESRDMRKIAMPSPRMTR